MSSLFESTDAKNRSLGENKIEKTGSECFINILCFRPFANGFQITIDPFSKPLNK